MWGGAAGGPSKIFLLITAILLLSITYRFTEYQFSNQRYILWSNVGQRFTKDLTPRPIRRKRIYLDGSSEYTPLRKLVICHVSDLHARVEAELQSEAPICDDTQFPVSRATRLKLLMDKYCPVNNDSLFSDTVAVRFFTGDVMHGSEYDLLEDVAQQDNLSFAYARIAPRILPFWEIDSWTIGNHEFDTDGRALDRILDGPDQLSKHGRYLPEEVNSRIVATNLWWKKNKKKKSGTFYEPYSRYSTEDPGSPADRFYNAISHAHITDFIDKSNITKLRLCVLSTISRSLTEGLIPGNDDIHVQDPIKSIFLTLNSLGEECEGTNFSSFPIVRVLQSHREVDKDEELIANSIWHPKTFHVAFGGHSHVAFTESYPKFVGQLSDSEKNAIPLSHVGAYGEYLGVITIDLTSEDEPFVSNGSIIPTFGSLLPNDSIDEACRLDSELLGYGREIVLGLVNESVNRIVADNWDGVLSSENYECRYQRCAMGQVIAGSILSGLEDNETSYICGENIIHGIPNGVALELAGDMRSQWPPKCDSAFLRTKEHYHFPTL